MIYNNNTANELKNTKEKIIMTQRNIDVMDIIVSKMAEGKTLSRALKTVYTKRNVAIPYCEEAFDVPLTTFNLSLRSRNTIARTGFSTVNDVIRFKQYDDFKNMRGFVRSAYVELLEKILDYSWDNMSQKARTDFLIDIVERNSNNIRAEIA